MSMSQAKSKRTDTFKNTECIEHAVGEQKVFRTVDTVWLSESINALSYNLCIAKSCV